jgi:signal transduction histidine kinase/HAMP domain-containing protein
MQPSLEPSDANQPSAAVLRRGHSVGTKLVFVTCLSLAVIFAVIYVALTQREKVNLLSAKQMAGEMVVDLFTESVCAALVFDDQTGVSDALHFLGKNQDVAYAAVWKRDAREPTRLGERVAELRRQADRTDYPVHGGPDSRRVDIGADTLTISAPVKDPTGAWAGQTLVVFSLDREQRLFAELSRQILIAASATATLIAIMLVGFTRVLVVRRLARLAAAAEHLERGESASIDRGADDEVGCLAHALSQMAQAVAEREARIQTQNKGMRLVLDNVAQGFITVGIDGVMSSERSAIVDRWFGAPEKGATFSSYVDPHVGGNYGWHFEMALEQMREDVLPVELVLDQTPKRLVGMGRIFDLAYTAITKEDKVERVLIVISDVTAEVAHEQMERDQRELIALFERISVDRSGVEEFLAEAAGLLATLRAKPGVKEQRQLLHTLKGNCATYGLETYAGLAHRIESELEASDAGLTDEQCNVLVGSWKEVIRRVTKLLGGSRPDSVEIERAELETLIERAQRDASNATLARTLMDWGREPVQRRLDRLGRQAVGTARRLGKPPPRLEIDGHGIRLDPGGWASFWSAMVHVVRNSVDHGIEEAATRLELGKPEAGTLILRAERGQGRLIISVGDDGKGIDWAKVKTKAASLGLPCQTREDLVDALFADGVSTREEVSETSGRGVGLAALRQVIANLGGHIDVQSTWGRGTRFEIAFDESSLPMAAESTANVRHNSLIPHLV